MSETQERIGTWADRTFPGNDPGSPDRALRILDELVEYLQARGASPQQIVQRTAAALAREPQAYTLGRPRPEAAPAEAGDVLVTLYADAHAQGFDLHAECDRKMAVNRSRAWFAFGDGTGAHVKRAGTCGACRRPIVLAGGAWRHVPALDFPDTDPGHPAAPLALDPATETSPR